MSMGVKMHCKLEWEIFISSSSCTLFVQAPGHSVQIFYSFYIIIYIYTQWHFSIIVNMKKCLNLLVESNIMFQSPVSALYKILTYLLNCLDTSTYCHFYLWKIMNELLTIITKYYIFIEIGTIRNKKIYNKLLRF